MNDTALPSRRKRAAPAVIFAGLLILAMLAGGLVAVGSRALSRPTSQAAEGPLVPDNTIQIVRGGVPQPFTQGAVVPITGKLMGRLTLRSAEAVFLRKFDLFLYETSPDRPYDAATVEVVGVMPDMTHSDFRLNVDPMGAGHYSVILPCGMNGQWEFDIEVTAEGKRGTIHLLVDVYE